MHEKAGWPACILVAKLFYYRLQPFTSKQDTSNHIIVVFLLAMVPAIHTAFLMPYTDTKTDLSCYV